MWFITHPITAATSLLGLLAHTLGLTWLDALWATLWHNAGTLFTALSVSSSMLPDPAFGIIPLEYITAASFAVGGVFVLSLLDKFYDQLMNRLENDDN